MIILSIQFTLYTVYFISFLLIFVGLALIKAFIHEVVWEYGLYHFRKKYLIVYGVYYVLFMIVNVIFNPGFDLFFYYIALFAVCLLDIIVFWIWDYRHMYDWSRFIFFVIGSFCGYVLLVELMVLLMRIVTLLALGY